MKCVYCGYGFEKKVVNFIYDENDRYIVIENVPANVCQNCGEKLYSPEVTDKLLKFVRNDFKPVKTIEIPVFDFGSAGSG